MTRLRLPASTPQEWYATHLHRYLHAWDGDDIDESKREWCSGAEALADDLTRLRRQHARYVAEGATAQAAAKWAIGEHIDLTAGVLGALHLAAGAVPAELAATSLQFGTHPDGWVQLVDLGRPPLLVVEGHPWAEQPDVVAVPDADALVEAFCALVTPLAETFYRAAKRLGKVGFPSLWAETSEAIGMCTMRRPEMPAGPDVPDDLQRLLQAPAAPWRKRPRSWTAQVAGREHLLGQKAGCCLAYQSQREPEAPEALADPRTRAFRARFPQGPDDLAHCGTCCFRDPDDVEARMTWDLEWDAGGAAQTQAQTQAQTASPSSG